MQRRGSGSSGRFLILLLDHGGQRLADVIATPLPSSGRFRGRLRRPAALLLKVLATAGSLSLQAHRWRRQASGDSTYRMRPAFRGMRRTVIVATGSGKPELIGALSKFQALCGCRDPAEILSWQTGTTATGASWSRG